MWEEMAQVGINSVFRVDADAIIKAQQEGLSMGNMCFGLPSTNLRGEESFTKADFEKALKKVSRKIKK
jgi:hypothetical protein